MNLLLRALTRHRHNVRAYGVRYAHVHAILTGPFDAVGKGDKHAEFNFLVISWNLQKGPTWDLHFVHLSRQVRSEGGSESEG